MKIKKQNRKKEKTEKRIIFLLVRRIKGEGEIDKY